MGMGKKTQETVELNAFIDFIRLATGKDPLHASMRPEEFHCQKLPGGGIPAKRVYTGQKGD